MQIDPNTLSPDGPIALVDFEPSPDGQYLAYALSQGGSDWETIHVLNVSTGRTLADSVNWVNSPIAHGPHHGEKGFFFSRYPKPARGNRINQQIVDQRLYFHVLGEPQTEDRLVYGRPDLPRWIVEGDVSENGRYLIVTLYQGTAPRNELYYADPGNPDHPCFPARLTPLLNRTRRNTSWSACWSSQDFLETL